MEIDIDLETFSKVNLKDVGLDNYAKHPSTKILCMAYRVQGEKEVNLFAWDSILPPAFSENYTIVAHNAAFEMAILKNQNMIPHPSGAICTAAMAAAMGYPRSLEGASEAIGLSVTKDNKGKNVMMQLCKPRRPSKKDPRTDWLHDEDKLQTLYDYCVKDVIVEIAIREFCDELSDTEKTLYEVDSRINERGVTIDTTLAHSAIKMTHIWQKALSNELFWLTGGSVSDFNKVRAMKLWLEEHNCPMESLDKTAIIEELEKPEVWGTVRRVLEIRQTAAMTSIGKYRKMLNLLSDDGTVKHMFLFNGAHTGRWAGKGVQLHNLPRGIKIPHGIDEAILTVKSMDATAFNMVYPDPLGVISSLIRPTFTAAKGKVFLAGDYASIEVRILAWLAGEELLLNQFIEGIDPYIDMASRIYSIAKDDVTPEQRGVGKAAVLGLGYSMGAEKFIQTCHGNGIEIEEQFANDIVDLYRTTFKNIKKFWGQIQRGLLQCLREKKNIDVNKIKFLYRKNMIGIQLPSKRIMYYIEPEFGEGRYGPSLTHMRSVKGQWVRRDTYGGKIVENITQAVARDILSEAMVRVDKHFDIRIHVHDEIVVEVETLRKQEGYFKTLMEQRPAWGQDIPILVETWSQYRYQKG